MTSRELCRRAIEFGRPERLPLAFPSCGPCDLVGVVYTEPRGFVPAVQGQDEWGAVWVRSELDNIGQIRDWPLRHWDDLRDYVLPDPDDDTRYAGIADAIPGFGDCYIGCMASCVMTLWERFYSLRGFTNALTDPYLHPRETHELLDYIVEFHMRVIGNLARRFNRRLDCFFFGDDWGTQTNTLFDLETWRIYFAPRYARLVRAVHDAGMHAILHSDGRINQLVPDLIEIGFDALNLHSPTVVGIEEIGRAFAGRIAFTPCIDIQKTFVHGSIEDVRAEARAILEWWGTPDGGVIPLEYPRIPVGAPEENVHAAYAAFREFGIDYCGLAHASPDIPEASRDHDAADDLAGHALAGKARKL